MIPLTIIVTAYNKAESLKILFQSLKDVQCGQQVNLVISIDNGGTEEVNELARSFTWHLGGKEIIIHQEKLGLVNHFIWVGDQTEHYEHVLFLEDDFFVSPQILNYALQVTPFFEEDDRVAGCALYNPPFTLSGLVFDKLLDDYDNFFYQHPYWGNIWYKNKWRAFKAYLQTYQPKDELLPIAVRQWRSGSFKRIFIQYLIESGRTIVFPRESLLTNIGMPGLHARERIDYQQTPIVLSDEKKTYRFCLLDNSIVKYDAYEELSTDVIKKFNPYLKDYDFELDTKYNRDHFSKRYLLTTRSVKHAIKSFAIGYKPYEFALLMNLEGNGIHLCRTEDLKNAYKDLSFLVWHSVKSHSPVDNTRYIPFEIKRVAKKYLKKLFRRS